MMSNRTPSVRVGQLATILTCGALALIACGSDSTSSSSSDQGTAPPAESAPADTGDTGGGDEGLPNACPVEGCTVTIVDAVASDGEVELTFDANYTPDFERNHIHVFWDSQEAGAVSSDFESNGFTEQGYWHPTDDYPVYVTQADASVASEFRGDSTTLCVTAADTDHAVIDPTIVNCLSVADLISSG